MVAAVSITLLLVIIYTVVTGFLSAGIGKLRKARHTCPRKPLPVTVVIPFRNEAVALPSLLNDLSKQTYPEEQLRIILVNDHSEDDSREITISRTREMSHAICLDLPERKSGKKEALYHGIQSAHSEWIIQTDADCRVGPDFVTTHMAFLEEYPSDLVAGLVTSRHKKGSFLEFFEQLDLLSLTGAGAGSFHYGLPLMCSGANLLYTRELYFRTRDFDPTHKTVSGDDMFLMIGARKLGRKVSFTASREAMVETEPVSGLRSLIYQRIRWGAKTVHYKATYIQLTALLVVMVNMLVLLMPVCLILDPRSWVFLLPAFLIKILSDLILLYKIADLTGQKRSLRYFLPVTIFYYFYQLAVLTGILAKRAGWKGRKV